MSADQASRRTLPTTVALTKMDAKRPSPPMPTTQMSVTTNTRMLVAMCHSVNGRGLNHEMAHWTGQIVGRSIQDFSSGRPPHSLVRGGPRQEPYLPSLDGLPLL
jgi:hypothetical protein